MSLYVLLSISMRRLFDRLFSAFTSIGIIESVDRVKKSISSVEFSRLKYARGIPALIRASLAMFSKSPPFHAAYSDILLYFFFEHGE